MKFRFGVAVVLTAFCFVCVSVKAENHGGFDGGGVAIGDVPLPYQDLDAQPVLLSRSGPDKDGKATLRATLSATKILVTPIPFQNTKRVFVKTKCTGGSPGDGSKGDWKGFFNAKKEDKAAALAAAVKGIGLSTAKKIMKDGRYFQSKPESWEQFHKMIFDIQDDLKLPVVSEVLGEYGKENERNLGYVPEGGTCEDIYEDRTFLDFRMTPVRIGDVKKDVEINIDGAPLLSGESENYQVVLGLDNHGQVEVNLTPPDYFNTLGLESKTDRAGQTTFDLKGSRNQIRPSADFVQVTPRVVDGKLKYQIVNNQPDSEGTVQVSVKSSVKKGLFKSSAGSADITLKGNDEVYDSGATGTDGKKVYYTYDVQVSGSPYFSNTKSPSKSQ